NGGSNIKRQRCDRPSGIPPDARQRVQFLQVCRNNSGMLSDYSFGCGVQIASAVVIAQTLPQPQHVLLVGVGESADRRKGFDEAMEVRNDRGNLSLLEHRLADEDVIWIEMTVLRRPPGKVAAMAVVPIQQSPGEARLFGNHRSAF